MPKHKGRHRLSKLNFDEVSLVGSGDNPPAKVVLSKNDKTQLRTGASRTLPTKHEGATMSLISKDDLPAEVVEHIEGLESALTEALEIIESDDVDTSILTDPGGADDEYEIVELTDEQVLAKADPVTRHLIEKADQRAAAAEAIAEGERDRRIDAEFISKSAALTHIVGESTDEVAGVLKAIHKLDPELAGKVEGLLSTANGVIEKSAAFAELGSSSSIPANAEAKAQEIRKADPTLTKEQAIAAAYEADPDLYEQEG